MDSKDLATWTISDKTLKDRAYEIARNCSYDEYQRALASMVSKVFNKKTVSGATATRKVGVSVKEQLAEELHTHITKNFKGSKIYVKFKDNIWSAHLADCLQTIKMFNIYYVSQMFSLKIHGLNIWKIEKVKWFLMFLLN